MKPRRLRDPGELARDPGFVFRVGQLIGATEMVGHWMALQGDETTKQMGEKLRLAADWFFERDVE